MIPSRSVSGRPHAKPAIPVPRVRARLHTHAVKFPIEIQGRTLCVRDTLLDEKSFKSICRVTRNLKNLGKVSFHDVQAKHLLIPQLFHDCLNLVAANKHIHHFDFTYSLSNPSLGISTLSDENAEDLSQMLKKNELNHLRYMDLTNNQFGYRGLTGLVKAILLSSIERANLAGHLADPATCEKIQEATRKHNIMHGNGKKISLGRKNDTWAS